MLGSNITNFQENENQVTNLKKVFANVISNKELLFKNI